jgi:hypothetical protein
MFNEGLPVIGETMDSLMFPDQIDLWTEKMRKLGQKGTAGL